MLVCESLVGVRWLKDVNKHLIFLIDSKHVNNPLVPYLRALFLLAASRSLISKCCVSDTNFITFMRSARFVVHFMFVYYHVIRRSVLHKEISID